MSHKRSKRSYRKKGSRKGSKKGSRKVKKSQCNSRGKKLSLISIKKSPKKDKKYVATFCRSGRIKQTHYGAKKYQNYGGNAKLGERHLDEKRKRLYISRHRSRENWNDPTTAGALSRWTLWNKKSFRESVADYKRRFHL